jgi:hypothetical protein
VTHWGLAAPRNEVGSTNIYRTRSPYNMCIITSCIAMETIELTKLSTKIFTCESERTGFNSDFTVETQPMETYVDIFKSLSNYD